MAVWQMVNRETGELIDVEDERHLPRALAPAFTKLFHDVSWRCKIDALHGAGARILIHLLTEASYGNIVPSPTAFAQQFGLDRPNATRAYRELIEQGFICLQDGVYRLNPYFCWKGNDIHRQAACNRMLNAGEG